MSQPPAYNRSYSFTNYQTANPTTPLPAVNLDIELNNVKATLDQVLANLALIQNDDTTLKNLAVGINQLSAAALAGFNPPKSWVTGTGYTASPSSTVFQSSKIYTCLVSHTSGTFATDLAAGDWQIIFDLTTIPVTAASNVSVVQSGSLTTDVQGSLQALDTGKAATSHTHASTAISDSTADGRAFLTATLANQKTLLGLGSLAFLNSVPLNTVSAQLTFTGVISPAALAGNTNDWAPTGLSSASRIRVSASGAINLTGLTGGTDGRIIFLDNVGSTNITLTNADTNSAAANRFSFYVPGGTPNRVLYPNQSMELVYDGTTSAWRAPGRENSGVLPRGYIDGLTLSNDGGTPNTIIDIAAGTARSDDNVTDIMLAAFTKTTGAWASGSGNGGLDTGSVTANSTYAVFAIFNPTTGVSDALLSKSTAGSFANPTMPTGFTKKRYIGSILTDNSSHIIAFVQVGDEFLLGTMRAQSPTINTSSRTLIVLSDGTTPGVPAGVKVLARIRVSLPGSSNTETVIITSPDEADQSGQDMAGGGGGGITLGGGGNVLVRTDTSQRVGARGVNGTTFSIYGFFDQRGRNG